VECRILRGLAHDAKSIDEQNLFWRLEDPNSMFRTTSLGELCRYVQQQQVTLPDPG